MYQTGTDVDLMQMEISGLHTPREIFLGFLSNSKEYDRNDSFPFD